MRARSILGLALSHFTIVQSFERTASSLCHWRKGAESQTPTLTRGSIIVARGRELLSHLTNRVLCGFRRSHNRPGLCRSPCLSARGRRSYSPPLALAESRVKKLPLIGLAKPKHGRVAGSAYA